MFSTTTMMLSNRFLQSSFHSSRPLWAANPGYHRIHILYPSLVQGLKNEIYSSMKSSWNVNARCQTFSSVTISNEPIRLSKLIASHGLNMQMSRKSAEMLIQTGQVTFRGQKVDDPAHKICITEAINAIKISGRLLRLPNPKQNEIMQDEKITANDNNKYDDDVDVDDIRVVEKEGHAQNQSVIIPTVKTRVWLAHKLSGELVAEHDPQGRPSLIERLERGGVGKPKRGKRGKHMERIHLKPIGRLDMITEGLILVTNDGKYKREMELPCNQLHRAYRVRVHGKITQGKLKALRNGMEIDGTYYKGMKVNIEMNKGNHAKGGGTNTWLRITCIEGKNRQIRRTLDHLGLKVTRLIRISYGDYQLNTIPPGMAIEVPVKSLETQKSKGPLVSQVLHHRTMPQVKGTTPTTVGAASPTVQWIRHQ